MNCSRHSRLRLRLRTLGRLSLALPPLLILLGGCSGFSNRAAPPAQVQLAVIDESLKRRCARPVEIPESDFHGVTTLLPLWQDDRIHLRTCGKRVDALVTAIKKRDAIQGAGGGLQ